RVYLSTAWWLATFPGLAILVAVLGINLFGDGLRDRRGSAIVQSRRQPDQRRPHRETSAHRLRRRWTSASRRRGHRRIDAGDIDAGETSAHRIEGERRAPRPARPPGTPTPDEGPARADGGAARRGGPGPTRA